MLIVIWYPSLPFSSSYLEEYNSYAVNSVTTLILKINGINCFSYKFLSNSFVRLLTDQSTAQGFSPWNCLLSKPLNLFIKLHCVQVMQYLNDKRETERAEKFLVLRESYWILTGERVLYISQLFRMNIWWKWKPVKSAYIYDTKISC
jgi:hypothetical protein